GNISSTSNSVTITTLPETSSDPCAGVAAYNSSTTYNSGDKVVYQDELFQLNSSGAWDNLGACGSIDEADTESPSTPLNLTSSNVTTTGVILNWTASTDNVSVTGYDIFQNGIQVYSISGSTNIEVTNLDPNTTYTFKVRAKDEAGNFSGFSNEITITTLSNTSSNSCDGVSTYNSSINYTTGNKVLYQGVLYQLNSNGGWDNLGACSTSLADTNAGYISVESSNDLNSLELKLFPNPVKDFLQIKFNSEFNKNSFIQIKSILGNIVYKSSLVKLKGVNNINLNLSTLKTGVYFLELEGYPVKKVIIK
uniref:T9SS type A sorting domain-containing protein n=1 Tax=uncultured Polaribacter sp. TaxID=174711 RepID=UPI00261749AB